MRVAHFIQRYPPALGGSEAYFARLSRFLAQGGDEVTVFTSTALALEAFWSRSGRCVPSGTGMADGVAIRRYALWRWPGRRYLLKALSVFPPASWQCLTLPCNPICPGMWRDAGRAGRLRSARGAEQRSFDLVHASAFPYAWPIMCARRLARALRVPFFLTPFLHLGDPDEPGDRTRRAYTQRPLRWLLHEADRVFVQTRGEQRAVEALGIAPQRIVLQGLGVDAGECTGGKRHASRAAWDVRAGETVIGHLANNSREKGTVDLLRALERISSLPVRVVLAGPEMPNFQAFWKEWAPAHPLLAEKVRRVGILDDVQKRDFFAGLDAFTLPSRSDSFGLVLLEAWANGVPSVVYRAGGPAEIVRHEVDGLQVRCGAIEELAGALSKLCRDDALRRRLGQAGNSRLQHEFCWADKLALVKEEMRKASVV